MECGYQELPTTRVCGAALHATVTIPPLPTIGPNAARPAEPVQNLLHRRPCSTFIVQEFRDWIAWFLLLPGVETAIEEWADKCASSSDEVLDYNQSQAWKSLFVSSQTSKKKSINLAFSLFTDWFNPLGNKISGRQVSIGVLALQCMNLPPDMRHQMKYTFLSGMVPAPNQPNMTTISSILRPLVDELTEMDKGFLVFTHHHPQGHRVVVRLATLVGDMVANHKVAGFTSHSGDRFCSWCECVQSQLARMVVGRVRNRRKVLSSAYDWKNAKTLTDRQAKVKRTGVRWSELNRLPYWNPVMGVGLGVMHNWLEGVLAEHFRNRWVFAIKREPDFEGISDKEDATEGEPGCLEGGEGWLSEDIIQKILQNLRRIKTPRGVARCPKGLGTKSNSEWHSLFAIHLPLAAVDVLIGNYEVFCDGRSDQYLWKLLVNFLALVECTHLVGSRKVTSEHSAKFKRAYKKYTTTSMDIQPDCRIKPNHHYAMHIPTHMQKWGPLMGVAEFGGERLCGFLQKINNNGKVGEY